MKTLLKALALVCMAAACSAQTTVVLAPLPRLQFFDQGGRPLAFGCVFSYQSGTTTPLATWTDSTGVTLNQNPVILSAGGSANIWLQAGASYSLKVKGSGGTQCVSGSSQFTVNGIGGGASTLTTIVPSSSTPTFTDISQNQLFEFTLTSDAAALPFAAVGVTPPGLITFQITQDSVGNHTFTWPTNIIGGSWPSAIANSILTQQFVWNGTNATAVGSGIIGPTSIGTGQPFLHTGSIHNTADITTDSILVVGPTGITSTNISASGSISAGGAISGASVSATTFTGNLIGNVSTASGSSANLSVTAGTPAAASAGNNVIITASAAASTGSHAGGSVALVPGAGVGGGGFGDVSIQHGANGDGLQHVRQASCTTTTSAGDVCDTTVTWPFLFDDTSYTAVCTVDGPTNNPYVISTKTKSTSTIIVTIATLTSDAAHGTLNCIGIHD